MNYLKFIILSFIFAMGTLYCEEEASAEKYSQSHLERPMVVTIPSEHTMKDSLFGYLDIKIHELLKEGIYDKILIVGDYDREAIVSRFEKHGKPFNWERPTVEVIERNLYIKCFPGRDYVRHYASLIATYLAINDRNFDHVWYILPDESTCRKVIEESNLSDIPEGTVAIIGYRLEYLYGEKELCWEGKGPFMWVTKKVEDKTVIYIGCKHNYWGDIGGRVVDFLAKKGFKRVIYVGKLGTLDANFIPNQTIATGNRSLVEGELVQWTNVFDFASADPDVVFGDHLSCPSVIFETNDWLEKMRGFSFVDPEIGHMAKAAQSSGIEFSYLHIISDNLSRDYREDLSNERQGDIIEKRKQLLQKIKTHIDHSLKRKVL